MSLMMLLTLQSSLVFWRPMPETLSIVTTQTEPKRTHRQIPGTQTLNQTLRKYYVPYEVINNAEIARYITPYGIGLDLGPEGFKWIYDVTDYASLLEGQVTFTAGNQQELIDLRFEMIEGTPVRDLKEISYYINRESRSYSSIADDINFQNKEIAIHPEAKTHKLVTRVTGHGHNTDDNTSHIAVSGPTSNITSN